MVHPQDLLRSNSNQENQVEFSAPVHSLSNQNIDCGITALPCLNRLFNLEKFAKPLVFVALLSAIGFVQGILLFYFRETAKLWSGHYGIDQDTADWIIYTNEFFVGFLALIVAYWGNRINKASWIGGLAILHSVSCFYLVIQELHRKQNTSVFSKETQLCVTKEKIEIPNEINIVALVVLGVYQVFYAMADISFICHGATYIDDNNPGRHSPGYIGLAIATHEIGKQIGTYLSWAPTILKQHNIFVSVVWIFFACLAFLLGFLISMFPRNLPSVLVNKVAASILDLANGIEVSNEVVKLDGFFKSLWRILRSKILIINILSALFIQSAIINLGIFQKVYDQARFLVTTKSYSGYYDPPLIQYSTNLLKQPLIAIAAIATGVIISKVRPKAKNLVLWNIILLSLITLSFLSTSFLKCNNTLENAHRSEISIPYCSSKCSCTGTTTFEPVCLADRIYFNPCFAGCHNINEDNNRKIYVNCTCANVSKFATAGTCDDSCNTIWALTVVNGIIVAKLMSSSTIINIIINMRAVQFEDKALALGLQATLVGLIPYLPIKTVCGFIAENFCRFYNDKDECLFYSEELGLFLSGVTIGLLILGTILAIVLYFVINDLELYNPQNVVNDTELETMYSKRLSTFSQSPSPEENRATSPEETTTLLEHTHSPIIHGPPEQHEQNVNATTINQTEESNVAKKNTSLRYSDNSGISTDDSLADLENVGDDHDSDEDHNSVDTTNTGNNPGNSVSDNNNQPKKFDLKKVHPNGIKLPAFKESDF